MSSLALRKRGVVLVNVGTPDGTSVPEVRRYLREFLSDPKVIDLPAPLRWLLLNLIILPFRPKRSAHAYQQIWTPQGSPLLLHSKAQRDALQAKLGEFEVVLAMRYGNPSLAEALQELRNKNVTDFVLVPLYPQHASATTGTTVERFVELAKQQPALVPAFHAKSGFVTAAAQRVKATVASIDAQHVLFSYHGLPVRQLKSFCESGGTCDACPALGEKNANCYRAQCYATSAAIASAAGVVATSTSFQSRLKGATWLSPFTDEVLAQLAQKGVKRLAVACPSFVADCLETLEEIGQRGKETFLAAGGEAFAMVPAVNDDPAFISMLAEEVRRSVS